MPEKVFKVKMYGFAELAMEYRPNVTKSSASKFLSKTIQNDAELMESLKKVHFKPRLKMLTPNMVKVIVEFLGEPY